MGVVIKLQAPRPPRRRWDAKRRSFVLDVRRESRGPVRLPDRLAGSRKGLLLLMISGMARRIAAALVAVRVAIPR